MTTQIQQQPGIHPAHYPLHVERVLNHRLSESATFSRTDHGGCCLMQRHPDGVTTLITLDQSEAARLAALTAGAESSPWWLYLVCCLFGLGMGAVFAYYF